MTQGRDRYDLGDGTEMFIRYTDHEGMRTTCKGLDETGYVCDGRVEGAKHVAAIARRNERGEILDWDARYAADYGHLDCIQRLFEAKIAAIEMSRQPVVEFGDIVEMVLRIRNNNQHFEVWSLAGMYYWRPM